MKTCALIVAAGMSTRMKQMKQIMKIGDYTMIEHIIRCFQKVGIDEIAVVTGYQAESVREVLEHYPVTILYNEDYEKTQMFDSVKIGLEYWKNKCDRILFCPVDVPAFSSETVKQLLYQNAEWVYPICIGRIGHPILISSLLIPEILAYQGPGGLKGALDSLGINPLILEVNDPGAVMDADTPEDYQKILGYCLKESKV